MFLQFLNAAELRIGHKRKFVGIGLGGEPPSRGVREDLILNILLRNLCKVWRIGSGI